MFHWEEVPDCLDRYKLFLFLFHLLSFHPDTGIYTCVPGQGVERYIDGNRSGRSRSSVLSGGGGSTPSDP